MITQVKHVTIPVRDQSAALKFYTEILGFKVVTDVPFGEARWIELEIPGAETQVVLAAINQNEDRIGTFQPIIFSSNEIHQTFADLKAKGVEFIEELKEEPWGTYCLFRDIDGNIFCLSSG